MPRAFVYFVDNILSSFRNLRGLVETGSPGICLTFENLTGAKLDDFHDIKCCSEVAIVTARAETNSTVKVQLEFASSTVNELPIDCLFGITYSVRQHSHSILNVSIKYFLKVFTFVPLTGTAEQNNSFVFKEDSKHDQTISKICL